MLKIASVVVLLLVGAVLALAATRPDTFWVKRATSIKVKKDPGTKRSYDGPPAGKGAVYAWEGDGNVGQGRMRITDAAPPGRVTIALDFTKPFEAHNTVVFTMVPAGEATEVTWDMQGRASFLSKLIGVFVNMDRMVGRDFELGLASLKKAVED